MTGRSGRSGPAERRTACRWRIAPSPRPIRGKRRSASDSEVKLPPDAGSAGFWAGITLLDVGRQRKLAGPIMAILNRRYVPMSETLLSSRNLAFELYEVLDAENLTQRERFADHSRETFDAALGTARTIAEKYFAPHCRKNDEHEPQYVDGAAVLIPEVKPAVDAFIEAGFHNASRSFEVGGMQLPNLL